MECLLLLHLYKNINLMTNKLVFFLAFLIIGRFSNAQPNHYDLTINIEPNCLFNGSPIKTKKGRLDLYLSEQPDVFVGNDSVIWSTSLNETNYIVENLEIGTYMIKYTPADTLLPTSKRIFYVNRTTEIHLDCYFFDLDYEPYSSTLEKGKNIIFYFNTYDGNPFRRTRIPEETHSVTYLKIERIKNKYYAHYVENKACLTGAITINYFQQNDPYSQKIRLKKKDLVHIAQFERNLKNKYFKKHPFYGRLSKFYFTFNEKYTALKTEKSLIIKLKQKLWNGK